ncbi:MAG TPA: cupin domain-containing protein [Thermomicrobiales bacterium]|nr:cupin domain-containing protein [Thermomicrobiales bacterium]
MNDQLTIKISLPSEIERFTPGDSASGRRAETLIKNDRLRVVLITMRSGAELAEHSAPGPITIHALQGRFTVRHGVSSDDLDAGHLIALDEGVRHAVHAVEDGAFLLTIGWSETPSPEPTR